MNFELELQTRYHKDLGKSIYTYVLDHPKSMSALFQCYLSSDLRICQRASDPLTRIAQSLRIYLTPFHKRLMQQIQDPPMDASLRNGLRFLQFFNIQEQFTGALFDRCYKLFEDINQPTGVRAFASTVLRNIAFEHPELKPELLILFQEYKNFGTVGITQRLRKLIKELNQK